MFKELILLAVLGLPVALSFSGGAPLSTCTHMTPSHQGNPPQQTPIPVNLTADLNVKGGDFLTLTIKSSVENFSFIGFLIRAISGDEEFFGRFTLRDNVRTLNCNSIPNSAVTHPNASPKTEMTVEWQAPDVSVETPFHIA
jgi:Reeler domain